MIGWPINRLTILNFGLTNPLWWHGWVMKIGYTRLSWSSDEVGVVLRWRQLSKSHKRVYKKKNESSKWEGVNEGGNINAQTAVEEFEYSFLWTYVLKFSCTCVLIISVEEHGYLLHHQVQDPLTANSTANKIFLPFNSHEKKDSCRGWVNWVPIQFRSKVYQFLVSAKWVSSK